jgi:O-acetylserine/cysteine efflux transporter
MGPIDPFTLNGWLGLFLAIELFSLSWALEGSPVPFVVSSDWRGWVGLLYTSLLSTIVAFGLWTRLVAHYPVSKTMPFMLTIPLFAILGGIAINGDRLTLDIVLGGALTVVGVGSIILRRPVRQPAVAQAGAT